MKTITIGSEGLVGEGLAPLVVAVLGLLGGSGAANYGVVDEDQAAQSEASRGTVVENFTRINLNGFGWKPFNLETVKISGAVKESQARQTEAARGIIGIVGYSKTESKGATASAGHVGRGRKARERELLEIMAA